MMTDELWTIRGGEPVLWTVPFRVRWFEPNMAEGHSCLAIPIKAHGQAIARRLTNIGARQVNGLWHIHRRLLTAIGQPMPNGTNPEDCYSWERRRELVRFLDAHERSEFVDAMYQKGIGRTRTECVFLWKEVCNHIFDWLINEDRPVDMYFIRLLPCPLRTNWMAVVQHRFGKYPKNQSKSKRREMADKDVQEFALKAGALAYQSDGICERHIELQHTKLWWKVSRHVEEERVKLINVCGYAEEFLASQRRFAEQASALFREFHRRATAECVLIRQGGLPGTRCFVAYTRTGAMRTNPSLRSQRDAKAVLQQAGRRFPKGQRGKAKRRKRMRYLRTLQQRLKDMRDRRRDVAQSADSKTGAAGVLVLDASQKSSKGELLARGNNWGTTRLAKTS